MQHTLSSLMVGESATVTENHASGSIRRRLLDIGLVTGTRVTCLFKSPCGDPMAYRIRGAVIAIRKRDSKNISVFLDGLKDLQKCGEKNGTN